MTKLRKQAIIVEQSSILSNQVTEEVALFNADGSPWTAPPGPEGGTDLSAIGTFLESVPSWAEPGFTPEASQDGSAGWLILDTDAGAELVTGWGATPSHYSGLFVGEGYAKFNAKAAPDQDQPVVAVLDENNAIVFTVDPSGIISGGQNGNLKILSPSGASGVLISDVDTVLGETGVGNGLWWINSAGDGNQHVELTLGNAGQYVTKFNADGSTELPGSVTALIVNAQTLDVDTIDVSGGLSAEGIHTFTFNCGAVQFSAVPNIGFFGASPVPQAAHPTLLSDVITILTNLGLCAA